MPINKKDKEPLASFPDPILSEKFLRFWDYPPTNTQSDSDVDNRIAYDIYGYTDRSPVYYREEYSDQAMEIFSHSEQFKTLQHEFDQCIQQLSDWANEQGIIILDGNREHPAEYFLHNFLERLKGSYYPAEDRAELYNDGKKQLERIVLFLRRAGIDLDFRKAQVVNLLSDGGLNQCSAGCIVRIQGVARTLGDHEDLTQVGLIRQFIAKVAEKSSVPYYKALCEIVGLTAEGNAIHAYSYLLERLKLELDLKFLDIPKDSFLSLFQGPYHRDSQIRESIDEVYKDYVLEFQKELTATRLVQFIISRLGNPPYLFAQQLIHWFGNERGEATFNVVSNELLTLEGDVMPLETSKSFVMTITDDLFYNGFFDIDTTLNSRLFFIGNYFYEHNPTWRKGLTWKPFTDNYKIYYSNIALSWINIDNEKQLIVDLIAKEEGLAQLKSVLPNLGSMDIANTLIQTPDDLNRFFERLSPSRRFEAFQWLIVSLDLDPSNPGYTEWKPFNAIKTLYDASPYIEKFAKLLKFLTQTNRKSFIVDFIEINSNDINENLQKKIFSYITITEEISHLPAEIIASHTLRCLLKDLIALGFKDFSNIQFANYRYPPDVSFSPTEDKPTYLDGIDFSHCSFAQAQVEVDVEGCSFQRADLHKAKFSGKIERANFQDASLIDVSFKESRYIIPDNAEYFGGDFAGALFSTMSFKQVLQLFVDNKRHPASGFITFKGANLSAVDFRDPDIRALIALLPKKTFLSFVRAKLQHIYLEKYNFPTVIFNYVNLENAHFSEVNFEYIYFYEAILKNACFIRCNLSKSNLLEAKKLEGIRLTETILVSDQLFKLYKRDVRDFSSVLLQDSLLSETFMQETLRGAKLSSQIFEYLIKNNFKNFQGADLSAVSFELFAHYQAQQELSLNFEGAQLPPFTHSFCSHSGERRKRSLYRCLILDTDITRLADRAHFDMDEKTFFDEELFIKLMNTRQRGIVISIADYHAILLAMIGERTQKLIITDHRMEALEGIRILLSLAREASTQEMWLRAIEVRFPLEKESFCKQINQWGNSIDFAHLKKALAYHLILFFPLGWQSKVFADELRQELGSEKIAAVYLGDHGLIDPQLSQNILTLLDPDTELYRRDSFFDPKISYYRTFALKNTVFDYSYPTVNIIFDLINQLKFCRQKLSVFVHLSSDWIPIVETVTPLTDHREQIEFFNVQTKETSVQSIVGRRFTQFRETLEGLYKKVYEVLKTSIKPHKELSNIRFNFEKTISVIPDIIENSETVDGLNAAFAIQALFHYLNWGRFRSDESSVLSIALQVHAYLNLAQIAHGTLVDLATITRLTQTLLREEALFVERSSLSAFSQGFKQFVGGGFNLLLNTGFIVLDSIELSQAQTSTLKAAFGSQLAFDSVNLALAGGAVGAGLLGYSTITVGLGGAATLLGGLAVGINGLVQAYTGVAQKSEAIGAYFYQLDQAYLKGGYERVLSKEGEYFMKPYDSATIVAFNFRDRSVIYDSSYLYPSYTRFGSGRNNLISWGGLPKIVKNKSQAINIRERLGYPEKDYFTAMDSWIETSVWVLPNTPSIYFSYGWNLLPGALLLSDHGFSLLRKLEENYDFHFDFYLFPGVYIISSLVGSSVYTPIHIYLDKDQRVLIMPQALKDIHYQIETSLVSGGQCILFLNGEASVTLIDHHADYTWVLDSENLSTDHLSFTTEGIEIGGLSITLQQPKAHYFFIDKKEGRFELDFVKRKARLFSVDYQVFKKQMHLLEAYVDRQTVNNRDSIIEVMGYPFFDEKRKLYYGTAYYYPREKRYLYTENMPQEFINGSKILYFDETSAYFYNPSLQLLWRTNPQEHRLERGYLLISLLIQELIAGSKLYVSEGIVSMTRKDSDTFMITQSFMTLFSVKENSPYKERKRKSKRQLVYELTRGQLILKRIADSRLLGVLSYYSDKDVDVIASVKTRKVCLYRSIFSGEVERGNMLKLGISEKNLSGFKDIKKFLQRNPWRDYPSLRSQFAPARVGRFVELTSFSGKGRLGPLLVGENGPHNYTVINPKIKEKDVSYLGSLLMPSQKQAFYFVVPENSFSMCHIYRQAEGDAKASGINLNGEDIRWIIIQSNTLFFLNKDRILKKIDSLGNIAIVGFTKKWVNATKNWINAISDYVTYYSDQPMERHLRVWGITDKKDRALIVWYDTENEMFAFMRPPVNEHNGQVFSINYLGMIGDTQFFYSENARLYYRTGVAQINARLDYFFKDAQLQKSIQRLKMLPVFVTKVYFRYQRLWFEIPEGFLFFFDPQEASTWFLEKIYEDVFFNLGQLTSTLQKMTAIRFLANIYKQDISLIFRNDSLIPIQGKSGMPQLWWNAGKELFFQVPKHEDAREWRYLGESQNNTACFFSPKEKKVYLISHTTGFQGEKPYRTLSSEFAIRMRESVLFFLDASKTDFSLLPQLKGTKVLGLQISAVDSFYIRLKAKWMNYYEAIFYQPVSPQKNVLVFDNEGDILASRKNQTVIISHTKYACQLIFPEAMHEERSDFSFQHTVLQIRIRGVNDTQLYEEAFPFIRNRLRFISINEENILALPIQLQLKSNGSLSVLPKLLHQQKGHLIVESSLYQVDTVQLPSKSNSFLKNVLSKLGKVVGGVGTMALLGVGFLFARRFIRNRSGIGRRVPSIATTLPLLERQGVQAKVQLSTKWISFLHKPHAASSSFSSQRRTSHEMASIMAEQFDLQSSLSLLTLGLLKWRGYQLPSFQEKQSMSEIEVEIEAIKIIGKLDELIEGISEEAGIFFDELDDAFIWEAEQAFKSQLRSVLIQGSSIYIDEGINQYIQDVYLDQLNSTSQKMMLEALKEATSNIYSNQQTFCKNYSSASVKGAFFYAVKKGNIPPVSEEASTLLPLQNRYI